MSDDFPELPKARGSRKNVDWIYRQAQRERRHNYVKRRYSIKDEYIPAESRLESYDAHLGSQIEEANCLVDVRGIDFLERVVSSHLFELLPLPTPSPDHLDPVNWSHLNYERIQAELAGEYPTEVDQDQAGEQQWIKFSEVSRCTGISYGTLKHWIKIGKIPDSAVHNNRIAVRALDDFSKLTRPGRPKKHTMIEQLNSPIDGFTQEQTDEALERTVEALGHWNTPVKEFVVTQYVSTKRLRLDKQRTRQLIEYGVRLGKLESWTDQPYSRLPHVITRTVGLPGMPHVLGISNVAKRHLDRKLTRQRTHDAEPQAAHWDIQHNTPQDPNVNRQRIQREYERLSADTKQEIIALLTDSNPAHRASVLDIQKAYGIMGGTVGMIKREFGLPIISRPHTKPAVKLLIPREVKPRAPKMRPAAIQKNAMQPIGDVIASQIQTLPHTGRFSVTVLQNIAIDAANPEEAFAKAKSIEGVTEVISIQSIH